MLFISNKNLPVVHVFKWGKSRAGQMAEHWDGRALAALPEDSGFNSLHSHGCSQLSLTPVPGNLTLSHPCTQKEFKLNEEKQGSQAECLSNETAKCCTAMWYSWLAKTQADFLSFMQRTLKCMVKKNQPQSICLCVNWTLHMRLKF